MRRAVVSLLVGLVCCGGPWPVQSQSSNSDAIDPGRVRIDTGRLTSEGLVPREIGPPCQVSRPMLQVPGQDLPPGSCRRIICGPNFWHYSATDLCCEEEARSEIGGIRYQQCYRRRPSRADSEGPWKPFHMQTGGPTAVCGNYISPLVEGEEARLPDWFVPAAFAQDGRLPDIPWSGVERAMVAPYLAGLIQRIENDFATDNVEDVGTEHSLLRLYVNNTYYAVRLLAHLLLPSDYSCPDCLSGLCVLLEDNFSPLWVDEPCEEEGCFFGETQSLNSILVNQIFSPEFSTIALDPSAATVITASIAVHETYHLIYHWLQGLYEGVDPGSGTFNFSYYLPAEATQNFEDEIGARIAGALAYYFSSLDPNLEVVLPPGVYGPVREWMFDFQEIFDGLRHFTDLSASTLMDPSYYVGAFLLGTLTFDQLQAVNQCLLTVVFPEGYHQMQAFSVCAASVLGFPDPEALLQYIEDLFWNRGGPMEFCADASGPLSDLLHHPSLYRNHVDSPDTEAGPGGAELGELPPEDFIYTEPEHLGESGSERENYLPAHCLLENPANADRDCFNWCWDHFATGQDGFICEVLTDYDIAQDCTRSIGDDCEEERDRRAREARERAEAERSERLAQCREQRGLFVDPECAEFCNLDALLNPSNDWRFCRDLCHHENFGGLESVCHRYCQRLSDPRPPYCNLFEDTRREEPPPRGDDGCPSGWSDPRFDSLEMTVNGCYPYIGNIRCCDVVGADDYCEPVPGNDRNFACANGSWCGCYENPALVRSFAVCMWPRSLGPWEIFRRSDYRAGGPVLCQRRGSGGECDCWGSGGGCIDLVDCPGGYRSMSQCIPYGSCSR